jgi:signal transduction histidine kinase
MSDGRRGKGEGTVQLPAAAMDVGPASAFDLAALLARSGLDGFVASADGRLVFVSEQAARLYGHASASAMMAASVRDRWETLVPSARRGEFRAWLGAAGRVASFEFELQGTSGGAGRWLSLDAWAVSDSAGSVLRYEGLVRDVSALRASAEAEPGDDGRFRDFEAAAEDDYWETGPDHRLAGVAAGSVEWPIGGADPNRRCRWDIAADAASESRKWRDFRRLLDRRETFDDFRYRLALPDGAEARLVGVAGRPVFDRKGKFLGYRGAVRDISEAAQSAAAHAAARQRLENFIATASDWPWETDAEHRFVAVAGGGRAERAALIQAVGKTGWEIADDLADEPEKWAAHRAALDRREAFSDFVYRTRAGDGERHWISISGRPVLAADGAFLGYRGAARLVTELVRHAEQLRAAKAQVETSSRGRSFLLSRMSHEIRTSLNAIIGFSEIMSRELFGKIGTHRYTEYVADIRSSAQGLLKLVDNIADLSDAETGRIALDEAELDLNSAVRSAVLMQRDAAKRRAVQVSESVAPGLPRLRGDRRRIRQILLNLLANAVRLAPRDGKVTLSAGQTHDGCLFLRIGCAGEGEPSLDPARGIEKAAPADPLANSGDGDSELSFALCKELVELHGGTLTVAEHAARGLAIEILFPRMRCVAPALATRAERGRSRVKPTRTTAGAPA